MNRTTPANGKAADAAATAMPKRAVRKKRANGSTALVDPALQNSGLSTVDKIVQAATELFAGRGYVYTTLDDVAAFAGFTKGAVYYYFKDKESLLLQVLKGIETRSIDASVAAIREHGGGAVEQLENFVKYQTAWAARHPRDLAVLMLISAETASTSARARNQVLRIYRKLAATLEGIIEEGKRTGVFKTKQETRDLALYLQAVHDGNMMIWYRSKTDPEIGRRLARVTLTGFLKTVLE